MAVPIAPERAVPRAPGEAFTAEIVQLAARERGLAREPERLLELRPKLPHTEAVAADLRRRVYGEDGFARLTLEGLPAAYHRLAYGAIGVAYGEPILRYGFHYEVADRGGSYLEEAIPISMTRAATGLHTDSSAWDCVPGVVALLCERPSIDGGLSRLVDAEAACAWLAAEAPEHYARLREPFIRDVVTPGLDKGLDTLRRNRFPVVRTEPSFQFRYMRYWIEKGQDRAGQPLGADDLAALDALDAALERPEFGASFRLERGDALFVDNRRYVHGREAYDAVPEGGRLLWRMWLDECADAVQPPAPRRGTSEVA